MGIMELSRGSRLLYLYMVGTQCTVSGHVRNPDNHCSDQLKPELYCCRQPVRLLSCGKRIDNSNRKRGYRFSGFRSILYTGCTGNTYSIGSDNLFMVAGCRIICNERSDCHSHSFCHNYLYCYRDNSNRGLAQQRL